MEYFEGLRNVKKSEDLEIYKAGEKFHLLVEGDYNGRHFAITRHSLGFPDVYIEILPDDYIAKCDPGEDEYRYDLYEGQIHGGATYYGKGYWNDHDERNYLGWDYAHLGDYDEFSCGHSNIYGFNNQGQAKKWDLWELMMSIAQAEAWIEAQNRNHWEELHALPEERDGT